MRLGFRLLLLKRASQQLFALLRFVKFTAELRDDSLLLAFEVLIDFLSCDCNR